jgi:uncharacterized protein YdeI (YjbR/CyaY-like superfamily)
MMSTATGTPFATAQDLDEWLALHHATEREIWVRIYRVGSGHPSVNWDDCVIQCLRWGWIDGRKKSLDAWAWLQRLTPRRAKSVWSSRNKAHVERLVAEGLMKPPGLAQVAQAQADGRWDATYDGQADMVIPDDFLAALAQNPAAAAFFPTLNRQNLFPIVYRLQTATTPRVRAARLTRIVDQLARGEPFH